MIPFRGWIIPIAAVLILLMVGVRARAADLPPGVDCQMIRAYVAEHGKARALAWAIEQGYGWRQIQAGRRCLK
jgi:hypothetical protein